MTKRADRLTSSDDNARKFPRSKVKEPASYEELKNRCLKFIDEINILEKKVEKNKETITQLVHVQQEVETYKSEVYELKDNVTQVNQLYIDEQEKYQQTLCLYNEEQVKTNQWLVKYKKADELREHYLILYNDEQQKHQLTLNLYQEEQVKVNNLQTLYQEADSQRQQYLTLYNEIKEELKHERHSKAGIKGWETRRKRENERLKREIGEMTVLLRDSLARKDEAVNNLYIVAERMDRIQELVDSVEEDSSNTPIGLLQKFRRIWLAIREILSE